MPSISKIFGCETEKTDLRNGPVGAYFDRKDNCLHGNVSVITHCYDVKNCPGFHYIDDGLGGSRYKLTCSDVRGLGEIRKGGKGGAIKT